MYQCACEEKCKSVWKEKGMHADFSKSGFASWKTVSDDGVFITFRLFQNNKTKMVIGTINGYHSFVIEEWKE